MNDPNCRIPSIHSPEHTVGAKMAMRTTAFDTRWHFNILGGKEFTFKSKNGLNKVLGLIIYPALIEEICGHNIDTRKDKNQRKMASL